MNKRFYLLILAVILMWACSKKPAAQLKHSQTGLFFGGIVKMDVCYDQHQSAQLDQAMQEIWDRFADIHWRLSIYDPKSDMNRINHSFPTAVTVGSDMYELIKNSMEYHKFSKGGFDITIFPLLKVWKESEQKNRLPTPEELREVKKAMGLDHIELLPGNQIRLLNSETKLTIDSIADGYAGDEAVRILRAHGFRNFLVDSTGELYAGGISCEGRPWRIGVQDPNNPQQMIDVLELTNASVATSGNYEHFYTIQGKRWSHIVNPITGFPSRDIMSATVIAPMTEFSDFWSTALCLLNADEGMALTDSLGEGYAGIVLIDQGDGKTLKKVSRHYPKYLSR